EEGKLGRRALVGTQQHGGHDARTRARYAGDHGEALRNADPEIGEEREARRIMLMRLVVDLGDPEQDRAADDQRETDDPGIEQMPFDVLAGDQPDDHRRQQGDQDADHEAAVVRIGEHAERDPPQFGEINHNYGEDGAELDQDRKALPEIVLAQIEEAF